jgi:cytochrome oxidase Cu insertion factor (SCO1/SenC/PrrC family)
MPKTLAPYNSLNSIANNLSTAEVNIAQNDREYGNRFNVAFENIEGNRASIDQTAEKLNVEVSKLIDADKELKSTLEQTAEKMVAKVSGYKKDENGNYILDEDDNYIPEEFG